MITVLALAMFVEGAKRYHVTTIYFNSSATTTFITGQTTLMNCIMNQNSATASSDNVASFIQWNSSSQVWKNMSTSSDSIWISTGVNPASTGLVNQASQGLNMSDAPRTITFRDAGTYNLRCFEPAETADDSIAQTSAIKTFIVTATCIYGGSGNWELHCSDSCTFTGTTTIPTNNAIVNMTGTGTITFNSGGKWTFSGTGQKVFINSGCTVIINSGGGWNS